MSGITSTPILKWFLRGLNQRLESYNKTPSRSMWLSVFKWNDDHHLVKNLLKLLNRVLLTLNKYEVFRSQYKYPLLGMMFGYICYQAEEFYQKICQLQVQSKVREIVAQKVLRNQELRLKLQTEIDLNVLKNKQIQSKIDIALAEKVMVPQRENLKNLVKESIVKLLQSQEVLALTQAEVCKAIQANKCLISQASFEFLRSETMLDIIKQEVAPLISGEAAQLQISQQAKRNVVFQLSQSENQEKAYNFIREKII